MQIDNSFRKAGRGGETANQPGPFHAELNSGDDAAHVILIRGQRERIEQANGGPPPASKMEVPDPAANFRSPDAIVTTDGNSIVLHPAIGQQRIGDYPGGKGTPQDVENVRRLVQRMPGPADTLFELFDQNYQSRVNENHTPGALKLDDARNYGPDARYQLHFDVDLYARENHGPLYPARDLRPKNDVAPGDGKRPDEFFAVISDKNNTPLNVLEYDDAGQGSRYKGQYVFHTDNNADGTSRVSVVHFVAPWVAKINPGGLGKEVSVAGRPNVFAGVSEYFYDANHKCVEAKYFTGASMQNNPAPRPQYDMKFDAGRVEGTIGERQTARNLDFFDLLGPRLPELHPERK